MRLPSIFEINRETPQVVPCDTQCDKRGNAAGPHSRYPTHRFPPPFRSSWRNKPASALTHVQAEFFGLPRHVIDAAGAAQKILPAASSIERPAAIEALRSSTSISVQAVPS